MATFVSMLRGINVSGKNLIKMNALQESYKTLGFDNVVTYLQSGNVVFTSEDANNSLLGTKISERIENDFRFTIPILVLSIDKLDKIIHENPFSERADKHGKSLYITFLYSEPADIKNEIIEGNKGEGEEFIIKNNVVYLFCPNGYGRTKLNNNYWEAKLKTSATTRNWKTVNEMLKIAQQIVS
ncbi:MAG: DUF1697 domain-containing protein [Dysgonomonas sp.]